MTRYSWRGVQARSHSNPSRRPRRRCTAPLPAGFHPQPHRQVLSPEIAQTVVNIGVDLGKMNTVGDLQGGIEEAERRLGYNAVLTREDPAQ